MPQCKQGHTSHDVRWCTTSEKFQRLNSNHYYLPLPSTTWAHLTWINTGTYDNDNRHSRRVAASNATASSGLRYSFFIFIFYLLVLLKKNVVVFRFLSLPPTPLTQWRRTSTIIHVNTIHQDSRCGTFFTFLFIYLLNDWLHLVYVLRNTTTMTNGCHHTRTYRRHSLGARDAYAGFFFFHFFFWFTIWSFTSRQWWTTLTMNSYH